MTRAATFILAVVFALGAGAPGVEAQVQDWPSRKRPEPLTPRAATFPAYQVRTLANGLRVVAVPQAEQPVVSAQVLVRAGTAYDPPGKAGLAGLVGSMLTQGTRTATAKELATAVDRAGAELTVLADADATFVQLTMLAEGFSAGLRTLGDVIMTPAFAADELERQRLQVRSALNISHTDPDYLASVVLDRLVFGTHPYGRPRDGTPASIARITRDDVVAFHARHFVPSNAILAIVGDITPAAAFEAAGQVFGAWRGEAGAPASVADPVLAGRRVVLIDMPGMMQAELRVGRLGVRRAESSFPAADLALRLLGGDGGNQLFKRLRLERGLTYGASAKLDAYRHAGIVRMEADTVEPAVGEAMRVMLDVVGSVARGRFDDNHVKAVKDYALGSYPLSLETPGSVSTKVLEAFLHELPDGTWERWPDQVAAVTTNEVKAAAARLLETEDLQIVVAGRVSAIKPLFERAGLKDVTIIAASDLDLEAEDLRRPAIGRPVEGMSAASTLASRDEWLAARAVLEQVASTTGGVEALTSVRSLAATAETVVHTPDGPMRAITKTLVEYPDRLRVDAVTKDAAIVQVFDQGQAWIWEKRGARDAPEPMRRQFELAVRRDWVRLLVDGLAERLTGRRLPDETGPGGRLQRVIELWRDGDPPVRVAVDAVVGRIDRISYAVPGPFGFEQISEHFSDYRRVGDLFVPFRAVTRRDETPVLERTLTELKVNIKVNPEAWEKPR